MYACPTPAELMYNMLTPLSSDYQRKKKNLTNCMLESILIHNQFNLTFLFLIIFEKIVIYIVETRSRYAIAFESRIEIKSKIYIYIYIDINSSTKSIGL